MILCEVIERYKNIDCMALALGVVIPVLSEWLKSQCIVWSKNVLSAVVQSCSGSGNSSDWQGFVNTNFHCVRFARS